MKKKTYFGFLLAVLFCFSVPFVALSASNPTIASGSNSGGGVVPVSKFQKNALPGAINVKFDIVSSLKNGGKAEGVVRLANTGSEYDIVSLKLFVRAKAQNGNTYHLFGHKQFEDILIPALKTKNVDFNIPLSYYYGDIVTGSDYIVIEAVVLGRRGNGYGEYRMIIAEP